MPKGENQKRVLADLFLRDKPARIMLNMKTSKESLYPTILSKEADCTYSHTVKILNVLNKMGLVGFEKDGRIKKVKLTDAGWDIAHNLEAMVKKLDKIDSGPSKKPKKKKPRSRKKSK